ncbi:HEXXH motif-containing putative peptide modification protein [Streptomyces sp. TP-A0356]|uniref:aKG-HExxH-type peptide beta-hydroxylase n=1 Tax=Streptomyces sp. TP-A0356 TaxID=1359208 RepID=UPI0006E239D0|nr:HEXXH motif-containing putative peptide modification protein [Streptomyces sp. TP-A0356]
MIRSYVVPDTVFDALAGGEGGAEAVALLRRARRSRNLLLLRYVLDGPCGAVAREAAELLSRVERTAPTAVETVVEGPSFGPWAHRAARDCPEHRRGRCTARDLAALATVAAVRAGAAAEISVPVHEGTLRLPGLGTALRMGDEDEALVVTGEGTRCPERTGPVEPGTPGPSAGAPGDAVAGPCPVAIRLAGRTVTLPRDPFRVGRDWSPVAVLEARHRGVTLRLPLETADPRLPSLDTARAGPDAWQGLLQPAWELLVESHPRRAEELVAGLNAIVPLPAPARGVASSTSRHAFGTVLASWPADPERLALTLLHEFQHSKLSALTDLVTLYEPGGPPRLYAPWRPDPRPPGGLLQGIYAHLGDLAFWRDRSGKRQGPEQADAVWRYAQTRAHAERGLSEAWARVRLTELGTRFLTRAAETVHGEDPAGAGADERLRRAVARVETGNEAAWRLRWAVTDAGETKRLAARWRAARPHGRLPADEVRAARGPVQGPGPELGRWAARQRGAERSRPARAAADAARAQPHRVERWAQLAASAAEERLPGAEVLRHRTELVRALYLELTAEGTRDAESTVSGRDRGPDPLALAAWLAVGPPGAPAGAPGEAGAGGTVQNTGVSMSQNARSPLANTSATG